MNTTWPKETSRKSPLKRCFLTWKERQENGPFFKTGRNHLWFIANDPSTLPSPSNLAPTSPRITDDLMIFFIFVMFSMEIWVVQMEKHISCLNHLTPNLWFSIRKSWMTFMWVRTELHGCEIVHSREVKSRQTWRRKFCSGTWVHWKTTVRS